VNALAVAATWPQVIVGAGGIVLIVAGVVLGLVTVRLVTVRHGHWRREPAAAFGYFGVMSLAGIAGGSCFLVAAVLRSHLLELTGGIVLVGSYLGRALLVRWLGRHYRSD
jgi:hypothetical protein